MNGKLLYNIIIGIALLGLVMSIVGCGQKPDSDAPEAVAYQRRQTEFSVRIVFGTQSQTRDTCARLGAWEGRAPRGSGVVAGCTAFDLDTKVATIYATEPTHVDDAAVLTLGHEVLHAYGGRYHD